jgi:hypothetical protein
MDRGYPFLVPSKTMSDRKVSVGEFESVFRNVLLPFGLMVDVIKISAQESEVGQHPFRVDLKKPGHMLASMSAINLAAFLNKKAPGGLHDFEVKLEGGKLFVSASAKVVVEVRASAVCSLEIRDEKQIWVVLEKVEVLGVGARRLVEKQLERINPVLDADDLPLSIQLESATVSEGELILVGKITAI